MRYHRHGPPPYSRRSPAEIADDEILSALRGDYYATTWTMEPETTTNENAFLVPRLELLLPTADVQP